MTPESIWPGLELWRLVTYPIALNFGGLLIGVLSFSQPGEEIEAMLGKKRFGIMLIALTLLVSLLYTAIFFGATLPILAGPQNLALFVMLGYVYLFPDSSVRVIFFSVRSKILLLVMVAIALGLAILSIANGASPFVILGEGGVGLLAAALWFHIVYQKYPVLLGPVRSVSQLFSRKNHIPAGKGEATGQRREKRATQRTTATLSDEDQLDAILEKISKNGYGSLNKDERAFLDEYSSRL